MYSGGRDAYISVCNIENTPAVSTTIKAVDQFNSSEALPPCLRTTLRPYPRMFDWANDQQQYHAVQNHEIETFAGDFT
jgi:hypothetical protein